MMCWKIYLVFEHDEIFATQDFVRLNQSDKKYLHT